MKLASLGQDQVALAQSDGFCGHPRHLGPGNDAEMGRPWRWFGRVVQNRPGST